VDGGVSRIPREFPLPSNRYTFGLAVLQDANVLLALGNDGRGLRLQRSADAGCSWTPVSSALDPLFELAELVASGHIAYAWTRNARWIYQIEANGSVRRINLPFDPLTLRLDGRDSQHVRSARFRAGQVQLMDSRDGGTTWTEVGTSPPDPGLQPVAVISGANLEHALVLSANSGAWVTFDSGNQWIESSGFEDVHTPNGRSGAISSDSVIAWLLVQDRPPLGVPSRPTGVYVSHDGGLTFQRVMSEGPESPLGAGGTTFWPHAGDANLVYFAFGSIGPEAPSFFYRHDAREPAVTAVQWPTKEGSVTSVAFHPTNPNVLYLGLSITNPD